MEGLAPCSADQTRRIEALGQQIETIPARATLQGEGEPLRARYLLAGWACRQRLLADGRRQIFDFVLPGDGIGLRLQPRLLAETTTVALTRLQVADAGELVQPAALEACPELGRALVLAADDERRRLLDHIVRLGRLTAAERVAHLMLELHERLGAVGLASGSEFHFPLTQEVLADSLGLSIVHINRVLQDLRRQGLLVIKTGQAAILDRAALGVLAGQTPRAAAAEA
jgi:CRP-like cAMP-binding protein